MTKMVNMLIMLNSRSGFSLRRYIAIYIFIGVTIRAGFDVTTWLFRQAVNWRSRPKLPGTSIGRTTTNEAASSSLSTCQKSTLEDNATEVVNTVRQTPQDSVARTPSEDLPISININGFSLILCAIASLQTVSGPLELLGVASAFAPPEKINETINKLSSLGRSILMGVALKVGFETAGWLFRQASNWWLQPRAPGTNEGHNAESGGINAPFSTARNWIIFRHVSITINIFPHR